MACVPHHRALGEYVGVHRILRFPRASRGVTYRNWNAVSSLSTLGSDTPSVQGTALAAPRACPMLSSRGIF